MIDFLIGYWDLIIGLLASVVFGVVGVIKFLKNPKSTQMAKIKEWLIWACLESEKMLGEKLGVAKLRLVYDMFLQRFPFMSKIISFELFSSLVDEALVTVRKMLESNVKAQEYVEGVKEEVKVKAVEVKVVENK